jgi:transcriptional regulator with XRE-family HTH domain
MIAERLRQMRELRGYSQRELAEYLSMGELQIWRYENAETEPKGDVVARIANILGVTSDYLLGLSDNPGGYNDEKLTPNEMKILSALRRGQPFKAIKIIAVEYDF